MIPMRTITYPILLVFIFLCTVTLHGQKGWEAGAWLGTSVYFGDLNTNFSVRKPGLAGGLIGRYNFNHRLCTKGSINYFHVSASDEDSRNVFEENRNLRFKSHIIELNGQFEFNFFPYIHGSKEYYFTPYLAVGGSLFYFDPRTDLTDGDGNTTTYSLRDFGTEGQAQGEEYFILSGALSLSGGFKWDLNKEWSINIEVGSRLVFTDYLDDVSQQYPDMTQLRQTRGETAVLLSDRSLMDGISEPGRQRGNSKDNDTYNYFGISLMKYFGYLACPKISELKHKKKR